MDIIEFEGWVEKKYDAGAYDQQITVANFADEEGKSAMMDAFKNRKINTLPMTLMFRAGVKNGASAQLDDVHEGDKVKIRFCISGKSGISKKSGEYYCINSLNICRRDGITVLERAQSGDAQSEPQEPLDIPF